MLHKLLSLPSKRTCPACLALPHWAPRLFLYALIVGWVAAIPRVLLEDLVGVLWWDGEKHFFVKMRDTGRRMVSGLTLAARAAGCLW
jgi:hypothetical protein